jgi:hypothetical protein
MVQFECIVREQKGAIPSAKITNKNLIPFISKRCVVLIKEVDA